jgi:hypothetical protein
VFFDFLKDLVVDGLAYHAGSGLLWIVTLGRYPPKKVSGAIRRRIRLVGWLVLIVVLCLVSSSIA